MAAPHRIRKGISTILRGRINLPDEIGGMANGTTTATNGTQPEARSGAGICRTP
jgi:hypothetical protein